MTDHPPSLTAPTPDAWRAAPNHAGETGRPNEGGAFVGVVRAARTAMVLTDPANGGSIVFANQAFLDLTGYAIEEVLGRHPYFLTGPDTDPAAVARLRAVRDDDADGVIEAVQYAKGGRRFTASILIGAFADEAGRTLHHCLTWTRIAPPAAVEDADDVVRRLQAALRESEEMLRAVFDAAPAPLLIFRPNAPDFSVLEVNQAYLAVAKRSRAEVVGRGLFEIYPDNPAHPAGAGAPQLRALLVGVLASGRPAELSSLRYDTLQPDGTFAERWWNPVSTPVLGADGRVKGIVHNAINVTERHRSETERREEIARQAFLLRLSDTLRAHVDSAEMERVAVRMLGEELGASRVFYATMEPGGDTWRVRHDYCDGVPSMAGGYSLSAFGRSRLHRWEAGVASCVSDSATEPSFTEADRAAWAAFDCRAAIGVPLLGGGRFTALLAVNQREPRQWTDVELALTRETAERVWAAIELARTGTALRQSEARLATAFESVPAGVAVLDTAGRVILANREYGRFLPTGLMPSHDPDRRARWQAWDEEGRPVAPTDWPGMCALRGEQIVPGREMLYTDDDGQSIWTNVATAPMFDGDGRVTGCVCVISDITARKGVEAALRQSEERLRQFGEASHDVLSIRDVATLQWTYLTPAFERIYGVDRDRATAGDDYRAWLDLIEPEDRQRADDAIARVRAGDHVTFEYRVRRPRDGAIRWLRSTDFPIRNAEGAVTLIGGIGHDITEQREAEGRQATLLAELQHRVRNILAVIRSIVIRSNDGERSVEDYVLHLEGRLSALARTQVLLTRKPGAGVDLEDMIRDELLGQATNDDKVSLSGPNVALSPKAAEVLTLAIHELATNATKYGAFARATGRVRVDWGVETRGGEDWLVLNWTEQGVPILDIVPRRQGFGSELIARRIPYELKGKGHFALRPGGLHCVIAFPLRPGDSILQTDGSPA